MGIPLPRLEAEKVFDEAVARIGGFRIDSLVGMNPSFKNADYYFESEKVIAELKEISVDPNTDEVFRSRIQRFVSRLIREGRMPPLPSGKSTISVGDMPEDCQMEFIKPFKRKLEGPVREANRQIRETKKAFHVPAAIGVLVLVNEGTTFFDPAITLNFCGHILKQLSAIDGVIYCSVNVPVSLSTSTVEQALPWVPATMEGRGAWPTGFSDRFAKSVQAVMNEWRGLQVPTIHEDDLDGESLGNSKIQSVPSDSDYEFFVQLGKFYQCRRSGFKYYCQDIQKGSAVMFLVESYQYGRLIQAKFEQKLVYANADFYEVIEDRKEIQRLKVMLRKMRKL